MGQRELDTSQFSERDALFIELISYIGRADIRRLAEDAGVAQATIYHWMTGETQTPRIDTLTKVARALGYSIVLKRDRALTRPTLRRVK